MYMQNMQCRHTQYARKISQPDQTGTRQVLDRAVWVSACMLPYIPIVGRSIGGKRQHVRYPVSCCVPILSCPCCSYTYETGLSLNRATPPPGLSHLSFDSRSLFGRSIRHPSPWGAKDGKILLRGCFLVFSGSQPVWASLARQTLREVRLSQGVQNNGLHLRAQDIAHHMLGCMEITNPQPM